MTEGWAWDWLWGLGLIGLTLMLHALGLVLISLIMVRGLRKLTVWRRGLSGVAVASTLLIGVAGWLLAILHGLDATVWAAAFVLLGAVGSVHRAMLYSVDCMATLGASGVTLDKGWSLLGPLEAANGMLLFGVSTAFLFTVLSQVWQQLMTAEVRSGL
jgi:hypothetical protein